MLFTNKNLEWCNVEMRRIRAHYHPLVLSRKVVEVPTRLLNTAILQNCDIASAKQWTDEQCCSCPRHPLTVQSHQQRSMSILRQLVLYLMNQRALP